MTEKELAERWIRKSKFYIGLSIVLTAVCLSIGGATVLDFIIRGKMVSTGSILIPLSFVWVMMYDEWKEKLHEWQKVLAKTA